MSKFLDKFYAALDKVASNAVTKAEVDELKKLLTENAAGDAANKAVDDEQSEAILALVDKLAESSPPENSDGSPVES